MSERMTNVEIEDILSSIRRLVSEEARPPLRRPEVKPEMAPAAQVGAPAAPRTAGRLVLTAAERIDAEVGPRPSKAPETALEARIAELEAMLAVPHEEFEADDGDPFNGLDLSHVLERDEPDPAPAPPLNMPSFAQFRHTRPAPVPATPPAGFAPEAVVNLRQYRVSTPDPVAVPEPAVPEPTLDRAPDPAPEPAPDVAPDDAKLDVAAPADEALADAETADTETADTDTAWNTTFDDDTVLDPEGDAEEVIDEAMLRDMVRDILREELQGALGERITRNVRKLVRAEIARAMTNRSFD